ncbi:unnamed protein product [Auanema sp. JU1783]|nr:unnamed protein product [Auanema sp. JU1783]
MKLLLVLALIGAAFAYGGKDSMLSSNRIHSEDGLISSTCEECEGLVKRFVLASHDEQKMREFKLLLSALCHETSYVEECKVFVANIDKVIHKLEPYLSDSHRVCKAFRFCANSRLDAFHRVGLLYAKKALDQSEGMKDLACDECQFAANELKQLVEDKEKQKSIKEFFSKSVCIYAYSYRGMCDMLVEQLLPTFFEQLDAALQVPKKACASIGFCPKEKESFRLLPIAHNKGTLRNFWAGAKTLQTSQGVVLKSCLDCELECDEMLHLLEEDKNGVAKIIQNFACNDILPKNFTASCEDFMSLYLPTVVYMTIKQYTARGICEKSDACNSKSVMNLDALSLQEKMSLRNEACTGTMDYLKTALLEPEVQHNAVASIHSEYCQRVPSFWREGCFMFTAKMIPKLIEKSSLIAESHVLCQRHQ